MNLRSYQDNWDLYQSHPTSSFWFISVLLKITNYLRVIRARESMTKNVRQRFDGMESSAYPYYPTEDY